MLIKVLLGQLGPLLLIFDCLAQDAYESKPKIKLQLTEPEAVAKLSEQTLISLTDYLNGCKTRDSVNQR